MQINICRNNGIKTNYFTFILMIYWWLERYLSGYSRKKQTNRRVKDILCLKTSLEFLSFLLYLWKFKTKQSFTPQKLHKILLHPSEILRPKIKTHMIFFDHPWKFHAVFKLILEVTLAISPIPLEIPYPQPPYLFFFLEQLIKNPNFFASTLPLM